MQVFVSIGDELKFKVFFNHDNLDIVWSDVSSFNHPSHGILGKYLVLVVRCSLQYSGSEFDPTHP